jgi:hypothetical protein
MFRIVLSGYCICCNGYTRMLQVYVSAASNVCCRRFTWMLHIMQLLYMYVVSVCLKYFSCLKHMLQVFLFRCHICCIGYTLMLQVYVSNVLAVLNVCCKYFYLDVTYIAVTIYICSKRVFVIVSFVLDVCRRKCFYVASVA